MLGRTRRGDVNAKDHLLAVRVPAWLLAELDAHAKRMKAAAPWAAPTRSDAARWLLEGAIKRATIQR